MWGIFYFFPGNFQETVGLGMYSLMYPLLLVFLYYPTTNKTVAKYCVNYEIQIHMNSLNGFEIFHVSVLQIVFHTILCCWAYPAFWRSRRLTFWIKCTYTYLSCYVRQKDKSVFAKRNVSLRITQPVKILKFGSCWFLPDLK